MFLISRLKFLFLIVILTIGIIGLLEPFISNAEAQTYIFANDGAYFTAYGPTQYWWFIYNQGFWTTPRSLYKLRWTYGSSYKPTNYARWSWAKTDMVKFYYGRVYAYIDIALNSRTTGATYSVTYNSASSDHSNVNQSSFKTDGWAPITPPSGLFAPFAVDLNDITYEGTPAKKICFDEIKVEY